MIFELEISGIMYGCFIHNTCLIVVLGLFKHSNLHNVYLEKQDEQKFELLITNTLFCLYRLLKFSLSEKYKRYYRKHSKITYLRLIQD